MSTELHTCPCCGFKTLEENPPNTYEICSLCDWEDDGIQFNNPDYEGGANNESLREAQHEFLNASGKVSGYVKDPSWVILEPPSKETKLRNSKIDFIGNIDGTIKNK